MDGTMKIQFCSLLCALSIYPLQIPLVTSTHILGRLERYSEFLLCEKGAQFLKIY